MYQVVRQTNLLVLGLCTNTMNRSKERMISTVSCTIVVLSLSDVRFVMTCVLRNMLHMWLSYI
jgi:hypothetical protein